MLHTPFQAAFSGNDSDGGNDGDGAPQKKYEAERKAPGRVACDACHRDHQPCVPSDSYNPLSTCILCLNSHRECTYARQRPRRGKHAARKEHLEALGDLLAAGWTIDMTPPATTTTQSTSAAVATSVGPLIHPNLTGTMSDYQSASTSSHIPPQPTSSGQLLTGTLATTSTTPVLGRFPPLSSFRDMFYYARQPDLRSSYAEAAQGLSAQDRHVVLQALACLILAVQGAGTMSGPGTMGGGEDGGEGGEE